MKIATTLQFSEEDRRAVATYNRVAFGRPKKRLASREDMIKFIEVAIDAHIMRASDVEDTEGNSE